MKHCIHGLSINPHSKEDKCLVCISPTSGDDDLSRLRAEKEALRKDAERWRKTAQHWEMLETLVAQDKVEMWIWSPTEQLHLKITEGSDLEYFRHWFLTVANDNAMND